jgi:hypothetical protein
MTFALNMFQIQVAISGRVSRQTSPGGGQASGVQSGGAQRRVDPRGDPLHECSDLDHEANHDEVASAGQNEIQLSAGL